MRNPINKQKHTCVRACVRACVCVRSPNLLGEGKRVISAQPTLSERGADFVLFTGTFPFFRMLFSAKAGLLWVGEAGPVGAERKKKKS